MLPPPSRQRPGVTPVKRLKRAVERGLEPVANVRGDCVTVRDDGYEYQGRPYKSLSAIARAITGTRWNGLILFGLK